MRIPTKRVARVRRYAPVYNSGTNSWTDAWADPVPFRCHGWSSKRTDDVGMDNVPVLWAELSVPADIVHAETGALLSPIQAMDKIDLPEPGPRSNAVQRVSLLGAPTGGTWALVYAGLTTAALAWNATALQVQAALAAIGVTATVTKDGFDYFVEFTGALGGSELPQLTATQNLVAGSASVTVTTTVEGGASTVNEVQQMDITGSPSSGVFQLEFDSVLEAGSHNVATFSASEVQTALRAMADTRLDGVVVAKPISTRLTFTFGAPAAGVDVPELKGYHNFGAGKGLTFSTTTPGSTVNVAEVQRLTLIGPPTGGTWTITFSGQATAALAWNASAAQIEAALNALSNLDGVTVVQVAPFTFDVTFSSGTNVAQLSANVTNLVIGSVGVGVATTQAGAQPTTYWAQHWVQGYVRHENNGLTDWKPGASLTLMRV